MLNNLYFPNDTTNTDWPFILETSPYDKMKTGCFITSYAMVLRNLQATKSNSYDFRTGFKGELYADPFTVMLANVAKYGTEITPSGSIYNLANVSHVTDCLHSNITGSTYGFNVTANATTLTGTAAQKADTIASYLQSRFQGVIVSFQNSAGDVHKMVFIIDRGSGYAPNSRFYVCDPAAITASTGNNVIFSSCASYGTYDMDDAIGVRYFG